MATSEIKALRKAVKIAGGQSALARKLSYLTGKKITQAHVWNWLNRDEELPGEYCIPVEKIVEGQVTRNELRQDLYPVEVRP